MKVSYLLTAVAALVLLWLTGNLMTGPLQEFFIFRSSPLPQDHAFVSPLPFQEVFIERPSGQIHGLYIVPEQPRGAVLYFHGNSGSVDRWVEVADDFTSRGYAVFIPDYRGFGKSTGPLSEKNFYDDSWACYEWLATHWEDSLIVVYGRSLGSTAAVEVASRRKVRLLFLETPFSSMKELFYSYYPLIPRIFSFRYELDNRSRLVKVTCPVIIVAGSDDRTVPLRNVETLKAHLKPGDIVEVIQGGEHNDLSSFRQYHKLLDQALR